MIATIQRTPDLTRNGNPYRASRLGATTGAIAGAVGAVKAIKQDKQIQKLTQEIVKDFASKGAKNIAKGVGKAGLAGLAMGAAAGILIGLGSLVGNLLDAPMNKELREQADGEAAIAKKFAMKDYFSTMINEMNQNKPQNIDFNA